MFWQWLHLVINNTCIQIAWLNCLHRKEMEKVLMDASEIVTKAKKLLRFVGREGKWPIIVGHFKHTLYILKSNLRLINIIIIMFYKVRLEISSIFTVCFCAIIYASKVFLIMWTQFTSQSQTMKTCIKLHKSFSLILYISSDCFNF